MIVSLIYQTLIIVILLTFSFGPSFFALINTSIKYGYKTAALLAAGVVLSDFILCFSVILIVHIGAINLLHSQKAQTFSAIIGGIILIVFGAFYLKKHTSSKDTTFDMGLQLPNASLMLTKGFVINLFNPTVWLLWLANVTAISKTLDYSIFKMILYFSTVLILTLSVELTKVHLAVKIKKYLTDKLMTIINYITGISLIIFGLFLIYNHYFS
ncbi:MAG: LysE family transporter [Bacteroidia bacterium]